MMIYYNGDYISDNKNIISYRDSGFRTGIGVFDTMLAKNGKPIHIIEHFERLKHDCQAVIGLTLNLSFKEFCNAVARLLASNTVGSDHARIRTTITGGEVSAPLAKVENASVLIEVTPCPPPEESPITCALIKKFPRTSECVLENCKRLDYSRSYAARRAAEKLGANDAIITNTDGNIACGTTSNIFIEEKGTLITPPLSDGVLAGVTRRKLIDERDVCEESISADRLHAADNVYLTNSFIGVRSARLLS